MVNKPFPDEAPCEPVLIPEFFKNGPLGICLGLQVDPFLMAVYQPGFLGGKIHAPVAVLRKQNWYSHGLLQVLDVLFPTLPSVAQVLQIGVARIGKREIGVDPNQIQILPEESNWRRVEHGIEQRNHQKERDQE